MNPTEEEDYRRKQRSNEMKQSVSASVVSVTSCSKFSPVFPVAPRMRASTLAPMKDVPTSLPSTGVLSGVSAPAREVLSGFGTFTQHPKGSVVVEQGGPAGALHIVVDGELHVILRTPDELVPF